MQHICLHCKPTLDSAERCIFIPGVWEVENVLDAGYDANAAEFSPRIVSIEVKDVPGVLNQVTGIDIQHNSLSRPGGPAACIVDAVQHQRLHEQMGALLLNARQSCYRADRKIAPSAASAAYANSLQSSC